MFKRRRLITLLTLVFVVTLVGALPAGAAGTGTTERVSVASDGTQGNEVSSIPTISADGRYVLFDSGASNLVSGDTNDTYDFFVHDRQTGVTERVSVSSSGEQGNAPSMRIAMISADGRYVAFESYATNLVSGDTNIASDIFVHDRQTGVTERVSVSSSGEQGNDDSVVPAISADGRYVVFTSYATNLVSGDTNEWGTDVFVHDRQTGVTERISVSSSGEQADGSSSSIFSISPDGRYVAFWSDASNLVSGDTNNAYDVFIHDRQTGVTERVSVSSSGEQGNAESGWGAVSPDGRYVFFDSQASNLVSGDTNGVGDAFVHDRQTGVTERISVSSSGDQANGESTYPLPSVDARYVSFSSYARNLVSGDTNGVVDVFVHDRQTGTTERVSLADDGTQGNYESEFGFLSADGRYVAFYSGADNLVEGDTNGIDDVFVRDRNPLGLDADTTGVFRPTNGWIYLKNQNTSGFADQFQIYGVAGDLPVAGDWDGDGIDSIGVFRNGSFYLRNDPSACEVNCFADIVAPFGSPGDLPTAGDWDGDGVDTVGVYRNGTFFLTDSNATTDMIIFGLGIPGDLPIAGDWDGDNDDSVGVFRPSNGWIYLKFENTTGFADQFQIYGIADDLPLAGDWDGDGVDSIGVLRGNWFYLRNDPGACEVNCFADTLFQLGNPGDLPIAGNWDGLP